MSLHEIQQEQRRRPKKRRLEPTGGGRSVPVQHGDDVLGFQVSSSSCDSESESDKDETEDRSHDTTESATVAQAVTSLSIANPVKDDQDTAEVGSALEKQESCGSDREALKLETPGKEQIHCKSRHDVEPVDEKAADSCKERSSFRLSSHLGPSILLRTTVVVPLLP